MVRNRIRYWAFFISHHYGIIHLVTRFRLMWVHLLKVLEVRKLIWHLSNFICLRGVLTFAGVSLLCNESSMILNWTLQDLWNFNAFYVSDSIALVLRKFTIWVRFLRRLLSSFQPSGFTSLRLSWDSLDHWVTPFSFPSFRAWKILVILIWIGSNYAFFEQHELRLGVHSSILIINALIFSLWCLWANMVEPRMTVFVLLYSLVFGLIWSNFWNKLTVLKSLVLIYRSRLRSAAFRALTCYFRIKFYMICLVILAVFLMTITWWVLN